MSLSICEITLCFDTVSIEKIKQSKIAVQAEFNFIEKLVRNNILLSLGSPKSRARMKTLICYNL